MTKAENEVWHLRPAFVMPYRTCDIASAEKILFLQKWAPVWALAHAFEKDVMIIHRLSLQMGRYSFVGTMGKEAHQLQADYQPKTGNPDGWQATMNAWRTLFPSICLLQCFWHAIRSLRNVAIKATKALYDRMVERVWEAYRATNKRSFSQRLRRVREWGEGLHDSPLKTKLLKLYQKKAGFLPAYDFPGCLRTNNVVDRLMRGMDKYLFAHQGFHGTLVSAEYGIRSYAVLTNFRPSMYHPIVGKSIGSVIHHAPI